MELFCLDGKAAIVTGGTRGIGRAAAEALCEAGAEVAVIGSSEGIFSTAQALSARGFLVHALRGDLGDRKKLPKLFSVAVGLLGGRLDIFVNSAGVQSRHKSEEFPIEDWDRVIEINLTANFQLCQLAGQVMLERGGGKIINVASLLSFFGGITVPAYAASKGGVAQMTKALSNEWAGRGVQVNAIAPGYIDTDMNVNLINDPARNTEILKRIPAGRWGKPDDLKGIVVFLASRASDYVSGAVIPVDGGYMGR
ncbi:MAG: SDR family oxidoreductase [Clostridiales bacterium]|nr:SDR family oxidoreductase [Clostridiales bacterium]